LLVFVAMVCAAEKPYVGHRLISVQAKSLEDLELLRSIEEDPEFDELDFWTEPSLRQPTDIRVPPRYFGKLQSLLNKAKKPFLVNQENLQASVDREAAEVEQTATDTACTDYALHYCSLDQIYNLMDGLAASFPGRVSSYSIGTSYEGRPIKAIKIVKEAGAAAKPAVWIEAGTHPREWIAIASAVYVMAELAFDSTSDTSLMLNKYDWYIVPVHNPDGYIYTHQTNRYWRKNRQTCSARWTGTDLNRNWDADNFGTTGTDATCSGDRYHGGSPFSAPETEALRNAVDQTNDVIAFFSIHAFSQMMLVPYGNKAEKPERYNALMRVANLMMAELKSVHNTGFTVGTPPDILYAAAGGAYDYMYDYLGVPWSYTYELRPSSGGIEGFNISPDNIKPSGEELLASFWAFANTDLANISNAPLK